MRASHIVCRPIVKLVGVRGVAKEGLGEGVLCPGGFRCRLKLHQKPPLADGLKHSAVQKVSAHTIKPPLMNSPNTGSLCLPWLPCWLLHNP